MFTLLSICVHVRVGSDLSLRDFGQLSLNVEGKSSEFLDVHALTRSQGVVQVGDQSSPDNLHLKSIKHTVFK